MLLLVYIIILVSIHYLRARIGDRRPFLLL